MEQFIDNTFKTINQSEFEKFALTILEYEAKENNKRFLKSEELLHQTIDLDFLLPIGDNHYFSFDAIAPEGLYNSITTYFEVKIFGGFRENSLYDRLLAKYSSYIFRRPCKIILITNLSKEGKNQALSFLKTDKNLIEIWAMDDLLEKAKKYPIEYNAFIEFAVSKKASKEATLKLNKIKIESTDNELTKHNDNQLSELHDTMANRGISLILGTGVSMDYNENLSWNAMADRLYDNLPSDKKFKNVADSLSILGGDNTSKAEYAKRNLGSSYYTILYRLLYPKRGVYSIGNTTLDMCAQLVCKNSKRENVIKKTITYNYDNFFEQALKERNYPFNVLFEETNYLNSKFPIYHVHGYIPEDISSDEKERYGKTTILSEEDYFGVYSDSSDWRVAIQLETFKDDSCLFIGNSISDFNEKRLLVKTNKSKGKTHFAIIYTKGLSIDDLTKIHSHFYYVLNIKIIWAKELALIPKIVKRIADNI